MQQDKALVTFEELDSELALELPERRLLQCNNNQGLVCVSVQHVCVAVAVQALSPNSPFRNTANC